MKGKNDKENIEAREVVFDPDDSGRLVAIVVQESFLDKDDKRLTDPAMLQLLKNIEKAIIAGDPALIVFGEKVKLGGKSPETNEEIEAHEVILAIEDIAPYYWKVLKERHRICSVGDDYMNGISKLIRRAIRKASFRVIDERLPYKGRTRPYGMKTEYKERSLDEQIGDEDITLHDVTVDPSADVESEVITNETNLELRSIQIEDISEIAREQGWRRDRRDNALKIVEYELSFPVGKITLQEKADALGMSRDTLHERSKDAEYLLERYLIERFLDLRKEGE